MHSRHQTPSVYSTLTRWARRTTSSFAELLSAQPEQPLGDPGGAGELIYKLKSWPQLTQAQRTADIFRTLSVMSSRPVNRHWILASSSLKPEQVDELLKRLIEQGAVDVIDSSKFAAEKLAAWPAPVNRP